MASHTLDSLTTHQNKHSTAKLFPFSEKLKKRTKKLNFPCGHKVFFNLFYFKQINIYLYFLILIISNSRFLRKNLLATNSSAIYFKQINIYLYFLFTNYLHFPFFFRTNPTLTKLHFPDLPFILFFIYAKLSKIDAKTPYIYHKNNSTVDILATFDESFAKLQTECICHANDLIRNKIPENDHALLTINQINCDPKNRH